MSGHSPGSSKDWPPANSQVLVSPATRFAAIESNVTYLPSALIDGPNVVPPRKPGPSLWLSDCTPPGPTLTRSVTPV